MNNDDIIQEFKGKAARHPTSIVLAEGEEVRCLEAAGQIVKEGIARPILLGDSEKILTRAEEMGLSVSQWEIIDPTTSPRLEQYANEQAKRRGMRPGAVRRLLERPLFYGAMMVNKGDAGGLVAGIANPSADLILAADMFIGLEQDVSIPSSFFIMQVPGFAGGERGLLVFADAAVNIEPSSQELADIAVSTSRSVNKLLGWQPRVALLSFSTRGSSTHARVDKITEALQLAREKSPELLIDGEFQADAAIIPEIARRKVQEDSEVAGRANILIFPDLDAGNIAYKLVQWLAGAKAYGPLLQGFRRPVNDLSRGADPEEIVGVAAITAVQAMEAGRS